MGLTRTRKIYNQNIDDYTESTITFNGWLNKNVCYAPKGTDITYDDVLYDGINPSIVVNSIVVNRDLMYIEGTIKPVK